MSGSRNKMISRKRIAVFTAIVFVLLSAPLMTRATSTKDKINQVTGEIEENKNALNEKEQEKDGLEKQADSLKGALQELNTELNQVSDNLEQLEQAMVVKQEEIEQTTVRLEEAARVREKQYGEMKLRIQFLYENRDYALLETLLASSDFSDFINRNEYIEQLSAYDDKKLEEFKQTEREITEAKAALVAKKEELEKLLVEVQAEQARVAGLVSQTRNHISAFKGQIAKTEEEMMAIEQNLKEQNATLVSLKKQLAEEERLAKRAAQMAWRNISDITYAEGDRYLLANLIYCEAGNQPYEGQVAVGAVVINRVLSPVFPDTITGVIYQNRPVVQFSPAGSGRLALALAENRATKACYDAADDAMAGASTVGNCLFFRTPIEGLNGIFIGGHVFYGGH